MSPIVQLALNVAAFVFLLFVGVSGLALLDRFIST
jgi:hypothetical protein